MFGSNRGIARNSLSKPAQFSFAADIFMLQAILKSEKVDDKAWELQYTFPRNCYLQTIGWILSNANQLGIEPFAGVITKSGPTEETVIFPNEDEQEKMHHFFEMFNQKRKLAQGVDPNFPPMPDIYQGKERPVIHVIERYLSLLTGIFDGELNAIQIPSGPGGMEFTFRCL